jgi:hypothetical protein
MSAFHRLSLPLLVITTHIGNILDAHTGASDVLRYLGKCTLRLDQYTTLARVLGR